MVMSLCSVAPFSAAMVVPTYLHDLAARARQVVDRYVLSWGEVVVDPQVQSEFVIIVDAIKFHQFLPERVLSAATTLLVQCHISH